MDKAKPKQDGTQVYEVSGMHCASCASMIELDLEDAGYNARCSYAKGVLEVKGPHNLEDIAEVVEKAGYSIKQ